jgi:hypothetical protein
MIYSPSTSLVKEEDMIYIDRGDPTGYDFTLPNFTIDTNWHDLDLSAIVPAEGANHLVHIKCNISNNTAGIFFQLRKKGNTEVFNSATQRIQVADIQTNMNVFVMCDNNRIIQYQGVSSVFTSINFVVRGWFES